MKTRIPCYILALLAFALVVPAPAAADDGDFLPEWSVGATAMCGDTTVASLVAAECLATEETPDSAPVVRNLAARVAVAAPSEDRGPATASCRYNANVVFFAGSAASPSDWLRVAQVLAANASPCAQYWIHVATLAANKLACRVNQAHQIRAHGPRFHAMCEAHLGGWQTWVSGAPGRTWYAAGVAQRAQMAAVGFDVTQGDTWSINELTSAIRRGDGNARRNVLDFMRGLYEGGDQPDIQGNVFVIGLAQLTVPTTVYKENLKRWLRDEAFWAEASKYVRFWGQEVYGDVRHTLVPDAPRAVRAENLNNYLQQVGMLADAGPDEIETARTYLASAHYPLANAAWGSPSAFGFTLVPLETMKQYIAIQEYAIRHYLGSHPHRVAPTLGYAWSPNNRFSNLPDAVFRAQWGELLEMLAVSIAESLGQGGSSQVGACGPPGEHVWCEGDFAGAVFNPEWALLRTWD